MKTTITFLFLVIEKCFPTVFWLKFGPSKVRSIFLNAGPPRKILQGGTRLLWARSLSESYIIILLNKLKIVEKYQKIQNKMSMTKAMGPSRDSQAPSWLSRPWTDVLAELPSHRLCLIVTYSILSPTSNNLDLLIKSKIYISQWCNSITSDIIVFLLLVYLI